MAEFDWESAWTEASSSPKADDTDWEAAWETAQLDSAIPVGGKEIDPNTSDADLMAQEGVTDFNVTDYTPQADAVRDLGASEADTLIAKMEIEGKSPDEIAVAVRESGFASPDVPSTLPSAEPIKSQVEKLKGQYSDEQILGYFNDSGRGEEAKEALGILKDKGISPLDAAVRVAGSEGDTTVAQTGYEKFTSVLQSLDNSPVGIVRNAFETYKEFKNEANSFEKLQNINASVQALNTTPADRILGSSVAVFGADRLKEYQRRVAVANELTVNLLETQGYKVQYDEASGKGQVLMQSGEWKTIDTTFLQDMKKSVGSELGIIGGGIAGAKLGARLGSKITKRPRVVGVAGVIGAVAGAGLGSGTAGIWDSLINASVTNTELTAKYVKERAIQNAKAGAILELVGLPIAAGVSGVVKLTGKGIQKSGLLEGQNTKIRKQIADSLGYTPEKASEVIAKAEANGTKLAGADDMEKYIYYNATTNQDFGVQVAHAMSTMDSASVKALTDQAGQLSRLGVKQMEDISFLSLKDVHKGWQQYRQVVKDGYKGVKQYGDHIAPKYKYAGNDKLVPKMRIILDDYIHANPFDSGEMSEVRRIIDVSLESGSVSDSMEIVRQLNKVVSSKGDAWHPEVLGKLKVEVREQMYEGIRKNAETPEIAEQFIKDYKAANKNYSFMKRSEASVLGKVLTNDAYSSKKVMSILEEYSDNPELIQKALGQMPKKYALAIEKAYFKGVMEKNGLDRAMGDVLSPDATLAERNAVAVDFRAISDDFKKMNIRVLSPQGKQFMETTKVFGELYDNIQKVVSSKANANKVFNAENGGNTIQTNAVDIFANRTVRNMYSAALRYLPVGQTGRVLALRHRTALLLKNPLDANNLKTLRKLMPTEGLDEFNADVLRLQQGYKLKGKDVDVESAQLYLQNTSKVKFTKYGKGKVSTVSTKNTVGSYPVQASDILDASKHSKADMDELINQASSPMDRGIKGIYRDGKIFSIEERNRHSRNSVKARAENTKLIKDAEDREFIKSHLAKVKAETGEDLTVEGFEAYKAKGGDGQNSDFEAMKRVKARGGKLTKEETTMKWLEELKK